MYLCLNVQQRAHTNLIISLFSLSAAWTRWFLYSRPHAAEPSSRHDCIRMCKRQISPCRLNTSHSGHAAALVIWTVCASHSHGFTLERHLTRWMSAGASRLLWLLPHPLLPKERKDWSRSPWGRDANLSSGELYRVTKLSEGQRERELKRRRGKE